MSVPSDAAPPHVKARSQENPSYPPRSAVPDDHVPWSRPFPGYEPTPYTHPVVLANDRTKKEGGWADPPDVRSISDEEWRTERTSHEGPISFDPDGSGRPLNPRGRTGLSDRGLLGKWGPNHAADPIVTRRDPRTGRLQVVAIRRKDTGAWALPGGMVDPGESVSQTVRREFEEEAGNLSHDPEKAERFRTLTEELFAGGVVVYRGYVDDPRNTDHSWMETCAMHFHCGGDLGELLPLNAGDDAASVTWLDAEGGEGGDDRFENLYASHRDFVEKAKVNL